MAKQEILQEYLLSLGLKVNQSSSRTFDTTIDKFGKKVGKLAIAATGAALAANEMVNVWARSMERLYYSSKLAESTAGNLQAAAFGAKQIGISGKGMENMILGVARAIRSNPGLTGLLHDLGVKVEGRDRSDVVTDLVTQLNKMPFYIRKQYGALFGMDPDDLFLMEEGLEKYKEAVRLRKSMAESAGLDMEKAAAAGKEYSQMLNEIKERAGILADVLALTLLPAVQKVSEGLNSFLKESTKMLPAVAEEGVGAFLKRAFQSMSLENLRENLGLGSRGTFVPFRAGAQGATKPDLGTNTAGMSFPNQAVGPRGIDAMFAELEKKNGLPAGLLDRMWKQESGRGRNMLSPKGAMGHFQFMPDTAREYGLDDPNNLAESADAAARKMGHLLRTQGGDLQKALMAYNWGEGNMARKGAGAAPWETQNYVQSVSGRPIQLTQQNSITVQSPDPQAAGAAVARETNRLGQDLVRNVGTLKVQ